MEDAVDIDENGIELDALTSMDYLADMREPTKEPITEFDLLYAHGLTDSKWTLVFVMSTTSLTHLFTTQRGIISRKKERSLKPSQLIL